MVLTSAALVVWLSPVFRGAISLVPQFVTHARHYGFQVYIGAVLGIATYNMDVLMVGALADAKSVGYYGLAGSVAYVVGLPVYGMSRAMFPQMTKETRIRRRWVVLACVSGLVGAMAVTALAHLVIPIVFSPRYSAAIVLVAPLALAEAVRGVTGVYNAFLSAQGRGKELRTAALVLTVSNLILNFALIPPFGALGAAWASVAALGANFVAHVVLYRRSMRLPAAIAVA
jgi:O-antigen/teichoic acid export membrane protein